MYKNCTKIRSMQMLYIRKLLLTVRLTALIIILSLMQVSAISFAQRITINANNKPLEEVLRVIHQQSGYDFFFDRNVLTKIKPISVKVTNVSLVEALNTSLSGLPLSYTIKDKSIIIVEKETKLSAVISVIKTQERTITGTVISKEDGKPLIGVTVLILNTKIGTQTDANGKYSIKVLDGNNALQFIYIGYQAQTLTLTDSNVLNVTLLPTTSQLGDVVVTAYGIQRQKNTLPYAAQQISGDDLNKTRINNVASGLSGKISGLQIIQGNAIGGSVNVVIRGAKSLLGNNQALFVVDGVPVDNSNNNSDAQKSGAGGYDYGNAAADINPDDILSVNVLKGAAASALYGSRAANGVIMITTKKPKDKLGISINSGVIVGNIDKSTFVKYQQEYGAGRSVPQDKDGFLFFDANNDGIKDLVVPTFAPRSWGPRYDASLMVYDWESFDPSSPNYQKPKPWIAPKNGPDAFYETAVSTNNSIMLDGLFTDKGSFKLGYTRNDEHGTLPNSNVLKNIVNFGASYNITPKLTASAQANYSKIDGIGRYGTGYDSGRNINSNFRHFNQTNVDILEQKEAYFRNKKNVTWNWADPTILTNLVPGFSNNIYWTVYENHQNDSRNRIFGNASLNYKATSWLNLLGRISVDNYNEEQEERIAVGSAGVSSYSRFNRSFNEINYDFLATGNNNLTEDLKLNTLFGINIRRNTISSIYSTTSGGLLIPQLYAISNSKGTIPAPVENYQPTAVDGYFGGATLTYKEYLALDATLRRDKSSTLPKEANAYYYYAVSGSYLFSYHLKNLKWLSSGKIRANYATVGNGAPFGSVKDVYDKPNPFGSTILFSLPNTKNNSELKPERTNSKEIGLEAAFLGSRIGFDISYYHTNSIDQIFQVPVSTSTGYSSKFINAGNIQNKGIELSLYGSPIKTNNFAWNMNINFTRNRNKVISLYNDSKNLQLGAFQGGVSLNASLGKPYGELQTTTYEYLNGQKLIKANGLYQLTTTTSNVVGNVNPDWIGGIYNSFRYKNATLSFLVDIKKGGDLFSLDMYYGTTSGILPETVGLNDLGNPKRNPVADGGGIILEGVTADGKPNTQRVTITSPTSNYQPQSDFVYDASYVKLREVSLAYALPKRVYSGLKFLKEIEFSLIGRNLWIIHKNVPYADPEENLSSGNIQGYQSGSYPTTRTVGLNVKVKL
jgi:TonB-linked SusC/RagA family outer membrane protein